MIYRVLEITPSIRENILLPSLRGEGLGERLLPKWRLERALKFKHQQGQLECALSYLLLQDLLEEEFGFRDEEPFAYIEHGKPCLPQHPEVHFNLSHCKHAVACVVSKDGPVGIDVECRGRYKESLAQHVLNEEELKQVHEAEDPDLAFTCLWTQKEALLKKQGTGITDDLKTVLQTINPKPLTINYKDYVLSVAE